MDTSKAVEIAKDIYWVGYEIPHDDFQCHVYLIKNGRESVLIDPGSMITFPVTLSKITSILPLEDIKYIILHHQDPDIVGCVGMLESLMTRSDLCFITHWRTQTLLKHYQWKTPFWLVDENDWKLKLEGGRELEFVFTPYAHFAGAFCTYDKQTGTLFSSDIFGGLTEEFSLYAKDESYFESLKLFHVHYMPSKVILNHTLNQIEKKHPTLIAPQHGSIIENHLIKPIIAKMRNLDCGLYLLDDFESNIFLLNKTDELVKKFFVDIISLSSFTLVLRNLFDYIAKDISHLKKMLVYKTLENAEELCYIIDEKDVKHSSKIDAVSDIDNVYEKKLFDGDVEIGKLKYIFTSLEENDKKLINLFLNKILIPFSLSFAKEINFENLETKAMTDELTGLYNRNYMQHIFNEEILNAKNKADTLSLAIIDIDFFKKINDTYGHTVGDYILKSLSQLMQEKFRKQDTLIRYGGEEILIIMPMTNQTEALSKLDIFRKIVEETVLCEDNNIKITISAGVKEYTGESINEWIDKVDKKLYMAKKSGRNKVL
jgi:diguanylate cyclase (GGDEF)-like protein